MTDQQYIIGLDISTVTIGITVMDIKGKLMDIFHLSLPKTSKKNGVVTIYDKAILFKHYIVEYLNNLHISNIFIEDNLKNSQNVNTAMLLAKFNGIISHIMFENFNVMPQHISVHDARSTFFPEYMVQEKTKNVLRFPAGDKKQIIFDKVNSIEPNIQWQYNKRGLLTNENYDRADSYVVATAGLFLNGLIKTIPNYNK